MKKLGIYDQFFASSFHSQVLYEKNQISPRTHQLFQTVLTTAIKDQLSPEKEFWTASNTLLKLAENYYQNRTFPSKLADYMGKGLYFLIKGEKSTVLEKLK